MRLKKLKKRPKKQNEHKGMLTHIEVFWKTKVIDKKLCNLQEIISYAKISLQKIETAIDLKQQEIEKLKEYKRSLINSCLTGKVKVG